MCAKPVGSVHISIFLLHSYGSQVKCFHNGTWTMQQWKKKRNTVSPTTTTLPNWKKNCRMLINGFRMHWMHYIFFIVHSGSHIKFQTHVCLIKYILHTIASFFFVARPVSVSESKRVKLCSWTFIIIQNNSIEIII